MIINCKLCQKGRQYGSGLLYMRPPYMTILLCLIYSSCTWKPFPNEKYEIGEDYRNLIAPYSLGDTLIFKGSQNIIDSFVISGIDSSIHDKKGYLFDIPNSKSISISYRQIPIDKWKYKWLEGKGDGKEHLHTEDGTFLTIVKFPQRDSTEYYYNFKEFRCSKNEIPKLNKDTIEINGLKITNYYKIENCAVSSLDENSIKVCFSTITKGLVAFKTYNDITWTRLN